MRSAQQMVTPEVTPEALTGLQTVCARIAASGGETGAIATEIARISSELKRLTAQIDEFLAS